MQQAGLMPQ